MRGRWGDASEEDIIKLMTGRVSLSPAMVQLQSFPPCEGAGLVHDLYLVVVPLPQLLLQAEKVPQSVHPP
eukprot:gene7446-biopygen8720